MYSARQKADREVILLKLCITELLTTAIQPVVELDRRHVYHALQIHHPPRVPVALQGLRERPPGVADGVAVNSPTSSHVGVRGRLGGGPVHSPVGETHPVICTR